MKKRIGILSLLLAGVMALSASAKEVDVARLTFDETGGGQGVVNTNYEIGEGKTLQVGDKITVEVELKLEGTEDAATVGQPLAMVQVADGATNPVLGSVTDISAIKKGEITTVKLECATPVVAGSAAYINVYNLKGVDFKVSVYAVRVSIERDGKKTNLEVPAIADWSRGNKAEIEKETVADDTTTKPGDTTKPSPSTGEAAPVAAIAVLGVAGAAAALSLAKKKSK